CSHFLYYFFLSGYFFNPVFSLSITTYCIIGMHSIALYAGVTTTPAVRELIESLISQDNTIFLGVVLAKVYFAANEDLRQDVKFRKRVIERIAITPFNPTELLSGGLGKFSPDEIAPIANYSLITIRNNTKFSTAFNWLANITNQKWVDCELLFKTIILWRQIDSKTLSEVFYILHQSSTSFLLKEISKIKEIYILETNDDITFKYQAEAALLGLRERYNTLQDNGLGFELSLLTILEFIVNLKCECDGSLYDIYLLIKNMIDDSWLPSNVENCRRFINVAEILKSKIISRELISNKVAFYYKSDYESNLTAFTKYLNEYLL
ncbi:MAG: hypothetical protein AAFY16_02255, partial [Cyanobacteria bacterium J06642_3]